LADKEPPLLPANLPDGWWAVWQTYTGGALGVNNIVNVQALKIIFKKGT